MTSEHKTYYDLLGVSYDATREQIRQAYEAQLKLHKNNPTTVRYLKLAWHVLGDDHNRTAHDKQHKISRKSNVQRGDNPPATIVRDYGLDVPKTEVRPRTPFEVPKTLVSPKGDAGIEPQVVQELDALFTGTGPPVLNNVQLTVQVTVRPLIGEEWTQQLSSNEHLIGRYIDGEQNATVVALPDPEGWVSRKHATLLISSTDCLIRDENSCNGTYVNGHRVPAGKLTPLGNDDRITIEGHLLMVHIL